MLVNNYIGYLIALTIFSIGLDKVYLILYIRIMYLNVFTGKAKIKKSVDNRSANSELFIFVSEQFKKLAKKNLRVPIKLYQL